ncbi:MAG TPA: hypothetical protein VGX68_21855 [Thermoanaerobaculia bacterium]|jgi:hypothetical protein|nr:hypothetical protein [Thermoanaerobaculia bacterium]
MYPITINRRIFLSLALTMLGGLPAFADMAIEVSAGSRVPSMRVEYNNELNGLMDKLRYRLVQNLQGPPGVPPDWPELALWKFTLGDPGKAPRNDGAPQLQFLIFEPSYMKNQIKLRMTYRSAEIKRDWDTVWIESGRLMAYGYPRSAVVVDELFDVIHDQLLSKYQEELRQFFVKSAPLTAGGIWDNDPENFRLVLPLAWDRYSSLSQSRFRLACSWPEKTDKSSAAGKGQLSTANSSGEVELLSCGTGHRGSFSTGKQPPYQALSVEPRKWRRSKGEKLQPIDVIRDQVRKLLLLRTYLTEEEPSLCSSRDSSHMEVVQEVSQ